MREFEVALKRRRRGEVVRLKLSQGATADLRDMVMDKLRVAPEEVVEVRGIMGITTLKELILDERPDLLWPSFSPRVPERVQDHDGDMFAAIRQKDMLLHHPYETFDMVVRFLQTGRARPRCAGHPPDTVSHLAQQPHRGSPVRGGRGRQIRDRPCRIESPL